MVNLQSGLVHFLQVDEALAAIFRNELILDLFGKTGAPAESPELFLRRVGKTVGRDLPPIRRLHPEGFELNAQFPNIARRAWRMIVTVFIFLIFWRCGFAVVDVV